ncbi:fascin-3 [Macrotis lagotis]|uniref:fascin-3 n=1 Tax=Macrotis lagotis TaxID=92651 RepID=UPI003D69EF91
MEEEDWMHHGSQSEDQKIGLISWAGTYLTANNYGNKITAVAKSLGRRQTWETVVCNEQDEDFQAVVRLQSIYGHILLPDGDGSVYCGWPRNAQHGYFLLRFHRHGKWTLQCMITGHYLESDGENVFCNSRILSAYHMWAPRPALHVHVMLYSPITRCYVRASPEQGCIWVDAPVPYLEECGFLLHFHDGLYHFESSSHHFLSQNDRLVSRPSPQTGFHLQFRPGGQIALGNGEGCFLYPQGSHALLALGSNPMGGEEWFILQHCTAWITIRSKNRKLVTIISELEVCAKSERMSPMSFFQYESNLNCNAIQLRSVTGQYLVQRSHRAIVGDGQKLEPGATFCVNWNGGKIVLRAANGRYVGVTSNGFLIATSLHPGPREEFRIRLVNRPFLALRGRYGYVGTSSEHDQLQCNMDQPDCIQLLPCRQSIYHFQAQGGTFWSLTAYGTFRPWGKFALNFCLELQGNNLLAVLAPNGYYLRADSSGVLLADSEAITKECLWEF